MKQPNEVIHSLLFGSDSELSQHVKNNLSLQLCIWMCWKSAATVNSWETELGTTHNINWQDKFSKQPNEFYDMFEKLADKKKRSLKTLEEEIWQKYLLQCSSDKEVDDELVAENKKKLRVILPLMCQKWKQLRTLNNDEKEKESDETKKKMEQVWYEFACMLLHMIYYNAFGIRYSLVHDHLMLGMALYVFSSFFNHCCSPNCMYYFDGNVLYVRAIEQIEPNCPLTIAIVADLECQPQFQREVCPKKKKKTITYIHQMILRNFGFKCQCSRCTGKSYITKEVMLFKSSGNNDPAFQKLLHMARQIWNDPAPNIAMSWKFYSRWFETYAPALQSWDVDVLSLLLEISERAWMCGDYTIGKKASEMGKQFCNNLCNAELVTNCHVSELKFMLLSLLHFVYWLQHTFPQFLHKWTDEVLQECNPKGTSATTAGSNNADTDNKSNPFLTSNNTSTDSTMSKSTNATSANPNAKQSTPKNGQNKSKNKNKKQKGKLNNKDHNSDAGDSKDAEYEALEQQLYEMMAEVMGARLCLFPSFSAFKQWIGSDLLLLEVRINHIVDLLEKQHDIILKIS
ncbi:hypothetical protein RFI_10858 [Reticulomyxa filosa]|uniref:SET domain-containing protein n=1 Tax=Reticulomyxa filosa TaxID=46433 RepID=X6NIW7_RETFI|nr:hypothetical protein RFI_10858 [Reticulomyxa filosa]|eukprot:ETO26275.1 hypothetical protein RFI_10858 [Reticulomyxa filosa]